jgi:hypothetical protein
MLYVDGESKLAHIVEIPTPGEYQPENRTEALAKKERKSSDAD